MKNLILIISLTLFFLACGQMPEAQKEIPIWGMWDLYIMEIKNAENGKWEEWRQGMDGYLLYEKSGYMSLHLMPKAYPSTDLKFRNFTDTMPLAQLKYISQNYNYTGSYTIDLDSSIVSHTKLSHSNPNEWGEISRRKFNFQGDTLFVVPTEEENASLRLKFLKMPNQIIVEN